RGELVAQLDAVGVGLGVVLLGRQDEAALEGVGDLGFGVLEIRGAPEAEEVALAAGETFIEVRDDVLRRFQRVDLREVGFDGVESGLVDRSLVHARLEIETDLLIDRTGLGLRRILRGVLHDLVLGVEAVLGQLVERAPAAAVGRDRVVRQPFGVDVVVEVLAGVDVLVEVVHVEIAGCECAAGAECQRDGQRDRLEQMLVHGFPRLEGQSRGTAAESRQPSRRPHRRECRKSVALGGSNGPGGPPSAVMRADCEARRRSQEFQAPCPVKMTRFCSLRTSMDITFYGAAGEVTGSCHLVGAAGKRLLLDCGMVQGDRDADARNAAEFPFDAKGIHALVLSHAHLDHCGRIPLLVKRGFNGPIYTTSATADLANIIMSDSAHIADMDAQDANRHLAPGQKPAEPLYTQDDVDAAMKLMKPLDYNEPQEILPGIRVILRDAGHILGSATVEVAADENGATRTLVFTGDLGPTGTPILCDPAKVAAADAVIMESTYGNRLHKTRVDTLSELAAIFQAAHRDGGNIVIP